MTEEQNTNTKKFSLWLIALLCMPAALVLLFKQRIFWRYICDDAYISFRYASNLFDGMGLTFNQGQPVEGFSNFLWTVLLGLSQYFSPFLPANARLMGLMATLGMIFYACLVFLRLGRPGIAGILGVSLVTALSTGVAYYSTSGLETMFLGFLVTSATYHFINRDVSWSFPVSMILFTAVALTRPEGILFLLFAIGFRLAEWLFQKKPIKRREWVAMAAALTLFSTFILFRLYYYHDLFPNTFYAKPYNWTGDKTIPWGGLEYIHDFLVSTGGYFALLFAIGLLFRKETKHQTLFVLGVLGCASIFVIYANVDWMSHFRFMIPYFALLCALGFAGLFSLPGLMSRKVIRGLAIGLILFMTAFAQGKHTHEFKKEELGYPERIMAGTKFKRIGIKLRKHYGPGTTLATKRIGAVGYYSGFEIYDLFGLVNRKLGRYFHNEMDKLTRQRMVAKEILRRFPDLILVYTKHQPKNPNKLSGNDIIRFSTPDMTLLRYADQFGYKFERRYRSGEDEYAYIFKRP